MNSLSSAVPISFSSHPSKEAVLTVFDSTSDVPFNIARVFTINANEACKRGAHAHLRCAQLLVCLNKSIKVTVDDGENRQDFVLKNPGKGLLVPPTLWAEQEYEDESILMVLTDRSYEADDYIRDYDQYKEFRKGNSK